MSYLYIPHGSDESERNPNLAYSLNILYIPHGSDESFIDLFLYSFFDFLYIPHGSDESDFVNLALSSSSVFISHMVQMKAARFYRCNQTPARFISHMVQMKDYMIYLEN